MAKVIEEWVNVFFSADKIPRTLNLLLSCKGNTIHHLCDLAVALNQQGVVPAVTINGLQPFATDYAYILKYTDMDAAQLRVVQRLVTELQQSDNTIYCHNAPEHIYVSFPTSSNMQIDDANILYGVGVLCHLNESSSTQHLTQIITDRSLEMIINSCTMRLGAVNDAIAMLRDNKSHKRVQYFKYGSFRRQ